MWLVLRGLAFFGKFGALIDGRFSEGYQIRYKELVRQVEPALV